MELNLDQAVQVGLVLAMQNQGQEAAVYRKGQGKISPWTIGPWFLELKY